MNESIERLIDIVQKASPTIWQAAYRQVFIDGVENCVCALAFLMVAIYLWRLRPRLWAAYKADESSCNDLGTVVALVGFMFAVGLAVGCLCFALDNFANPTFAAIKALAELVVPHK
jgi:hypothetical protein